MDAQAQVNYGHQASNQVAGKQYTFYIKGLKYEFGACLNINDFKHKRMYELIIDEGFYNMGKGYNSKIQGFRDYEQFLWSLFQSETINPDSVNKKQFGEWISYYEKIQFAIFQKGLMKIKISSFNPRTKKNKVYLNQLRFEDCGQLHQEDLMKPVEEDLEKEKQQNERLREQIRSLKQKEEERNNYILGLEIKILDLEEANRKIRKDYEQQILQLRRGNAISNSDADQNTASLADKMVDKKSAFYKLFDVAHNYVQYKGDDMVSTQILFDLKIPRVGLFLFKVKMSKLNGKNTIIGVLDRDVCIGKRSSFDSGHAVAYSSFMGNKYPPYASLKKLQGGGFVQNQIITLQIDLQNGVIKWYADTFLKTEINFPQLCNQKIKWVPFIELMSKGDKIQLLPSQWCVNK